MNDMSSLFSLWVYLSASPLLWLTLTLGVYLAAQRLAAVTGFHPVANPVLFSIITIATVLYFTETPYSVYFQGAQFVHFLLGPATVALAIPLYRVRFLLRASAVPVLAALFVGASFAVISSVATAAVLGAPRPLLLALAPKSITAGIAVGVANQIGGSPALTAVIVIATGIIGAIVVTPMMNTLKITDYAARGFAAGLTSHGIGTARAFQVSSLAGAYAGLAMALNGLLTSIMVPAFFAYIW